MGEGVLWSFVGVFAAVTVVLSWVPQIARIVTTRRAEDISLGLPLLMIPGSTLWGMYGIHLNDMIIVTVNITILLFNVRFLLLKGRYGRVRT